MGKEMAAREKRKKNIPAGQKEKGKDSEDET